MYIYICVFIIYCIYYNLLRGVAEANPSSFNFASQLPSGPLSTAQPSWKKFGDGVHCHCSAVGRRQAAEPKRTDQKKTWRLANIPKRWRIMEVKPTWAIGCTRDVGDTCLIKPSPPPPPPPPQQPQQPRQPRQPTTRKTTTTTTTTTNSNSSNVARQKMESAWLTSGN